jgi:ABC-2 type transport system permease protein
MFNKRVLAVFKREVREKLLSKGFIIMTILLPTLMFGLIGIQVALRTEGTTTYNITIASESQNITSKIEREIEASDLEKENFKFNYFTFNKQELNDYLEEQRQPLLDEKITGILFIPDSALVTKRLEYYSKSPTSIKISETLGKHINKILIDEYFAGHNLSDDELDFARTGINMTGYKVTKDKGFEEEGYGNLVLSYIFTFLLYISLLLMGTMIMQSVIEEKTSRIVEVILSSVSAKEIMTAKILGSAVTGAMQMLIWLSPIILLISTTWFVLPKELLFSIDGYIVLYFLINFFLGLLIFLGLFATVGAIFDNAQDAQSGLWPVMMLIIIPFFIALSMMENPNSAIAKIASFVPFANIIIMPARMTISQVPLYEVLLSLMVSIATIYLIFPLAGKIYRVGILRTGKKPKWSEVVKWLKYNY